MSRSNESNGVSWYRQTFGALYPLVYSHRDFEKADTEILALRGWTPLRPGTRILDSCCGNGRHLQALVKAGCDAYGFDLSVELVAMASSTPALKHRICRADIRNIPFKVSFDVVLNLFTSFGYFREDDENAEALSELASCLLPGGLLVMDLMNAERIRKTLVPESESIQRGRRIVQQRWIRGNRVQKRIEITNSMGDQWAFREDVRLFEPDEIVGLMVSAGLADPVLAGGFDGRPFESESERMLVTARRV